MKSREKSIFNLIEIFRTSQSAEKQTVLAAEHCEQKYHHDFYCDAEQPFIRTY
nr:hypothetical protein [uncultured Allomuricauda sp.]